MSEFDKTQDTNSYEALGGADTCRKLAVAFYARVPRDPVLRRLYPASSHCAVDALTAFFVQIFGGPNEYSRRRYWQSLREAHARFRIGPAERDAWMKTMKEALEDAVAEEPARSALGLFFEQASSYLINDPVLAGAELARGSEGEGGCFEREIARRWTAEQARDEIVAAVRERNAARAIKLIETPATQDYLKQDRAAFVGILAEMVSGRIPNLAEYVRQTLLSQPDLAHERYYYQRTLLHEAAGKGNGNFVKLLLALGVDPNGSDDYGHTPLYCAGNERGNENVVHTLARAGADVNAQDKIKQCTALHMAARRGNIAVAAALLACGANIEARDRSGETPLRRAVNCGKPEMVKFLLERGADANSIGSKGLTVWQAARGATMKQLFELSRPQH